MDKTAYDRINEYCTSKSDGVLVQAERDYVLRKFLESYYAAIERYKKEHNTDPPAEEEKTIINSLLNDTTMRSFIDSAKIYYDKYKTNIENDLQKRLDKTGFWKSVGSSILANLLYSIILIIIFFVAKDQIGTWLTQLGI